MIFNVRFKIRTSERSKSSRAVLYVVRSCRMSGGLRPGEFDSSRAQKEKLRKTEREIAVWNGGLRARTCLLIVDPVVGLTGGGVWENANPSDFAFVICLQRTSEKQCSWLRNVHLRSDVYSTVATPTHRALPPHLVGCPLCQSSRLGIRRCAREGTHPHTTSAGMRPHLFSVPLSVKPTTSGLVASDLPRHLASSLHPHLGAKVRKSPPP